MVKNFSEKLKNIFSPNTDGPYYYLSVLAIALLIFGFSFYQAQGNLKEPFKISAERFADTEQANSAGVDLEDAEALKKLDTDNDGLSDYLELYVYGTSAYIEDTDSDGLNDRVEVLSGTNPLCGLEGGCNNNPILNSPSSSDPDILSSYNNEEDLKERLIELGFSPEDLAVLSSQDMIELLEQANNLLANSATTKNAAGVAGLYDLTADELRDLLIADGASAEDLASISDEQLMEMYNQTLQENINN